MLSEAEKRKIEEEEKYRAKMNSKYSSPLEKRERKSRIAAGVIAILLGGLGIHKFYLRKPV